MLVVGITIFYAFFSFFEIVSLKKMNKKKEVKVFCLFMGIAFVISILLAFGIKLPSFNRFIGNIVTSVTGE